MDLHENNPLILSILQVLRQATNRLGIHQLLQAVRAITDIPRLDKDDKLDLYKLNWLLMNGLFGLQQEFSQQGYYLHISTLDIYLEPAADNVSDSQEVDIAPLREYYLNWEHFNQTTKEDVEALLEGTWEPVLSADEERRALLVLDLDKSATFSDIKKRFRILAAASHPDRGGDASQFIEIREAYQCLKQRYAMR